MDLEYIKANGVYYRPSDRADDFFEVVIKKMSYGRFKVVKRYYFKTHRENDYKIILYPSGIEEIKYKNNV